MTPEDMRTIGVVVGAHGLQGSLKIESLTDFPERFEVDRCVILVRDGSPPKEYTIKRVRWSGAQVLLNLHDLTTRDEAEAMRGYEVCVRMEDSWELPENVYYGSDLIGYRAVSKDGVEIGVLKNILSGAQDILEFDGPHGELMVPLVKDWVGEINSDKRTIELLNWERLLGIEESPPPRFTDAH
jgi:16S rRNA processing protein RimM